jgi:hypothetical protein
MLHVMWLLPQHFISEMTFWPKHRNCELSDPDPYVVPALILQQTLISDHQQQTKLIEQVSTVLPPLHNIE